mmetsp:Transcript_5960/g.7300  ORF Transcript_5960/g.7300 Transcript_5960/m.7300 type:complete len:210 (+) Transcript_5960:125-754(+)
MPDSPAEHKKVRHRDLISVLRESIMIPFVSNIFYLIGCGRSIYHSRGFMQRKHLLKENKGVINSANDVLRKSIRQGTKHDFEARKAVSLGDLSLNKKVGRRIKGKNERISSALLNMKPDSVQRHLSSLDRDSIYKNIISSEVAIIIRMRHQWHHGTFGLAWCMLQMLIMVYWLLLLARVGHPHFMLMKTKMQRIMATTPIINRFEVFVE